MRDSLRPTVTAIICTLNEEESLPHILPLIPAWVDEVFLVDGGSTDRTVELARRLRHDVKVLVQPGKGKGNALRYGIQNAAGEIIITLDADGETDPREMNKFIDPLLMGCDFVKGTRLAWGRPRGMPRYRWLGNKILAATFNLLYGTRFSDICSGFNAFRKDSFLELERRIGHEGFEMEQQTLAVALKFGMKIVEVSHYSEGRIAGKSKIVGVFQGVLNWLVIVKERFAP
jgi:glycosyltransferase involved in cell wall biosynthesis